MNFMMDPYASLGVNKSASLEEIKKAYRKLAKQSHPDLNPGDKEAEKKFKNIQHAFDLIGTTEAKEKFDRGETDEQKQHQYENYRQGRGPFYSQTQQQTGRYTSAFDEEDLFSELFGRRSGKTHSRPLAGEDQLYLIEIDFLEAALGGEKMITLPNGRKLQVKIPAGIEEGQKLKFKGLGGEGITGGPAGNALVEIKIRPHPLYQRIGKDIFSEVPVSLFEAAIGAEIKVPTIDGEVMMKISPATSSGSKLRIRDKGVGLPGSRGNHIVTVKIVMPQKMDGDFSLALQELARLYAYNPRGAA